MFTVQRKFSPCGKFCAYISQQGRFVVYNVETNVIHHVYTPNMHLNVPCTSFTWIQTKAKKKNKKSRSSLVEDTPDGQLLAAFGTRKGAVAFYSLATAKIVNTCQGNGHSASITAIYFNAENNPDKLYTAGADGKVCEWSISKATHLKTYNIGVEKLTCVLEHSGIILTGAKQLHVWDTQNEKLLRTLIGHTSNTQLLQLVPVDEEEIYVLSGSENDRHISLWLLCDNKKTSPVASFALDDVPEFLSPKLVGKKLHLVAVSRSGIAYYFVRDLQKLSMKKPYRANHTFEVAIDTVSAKMKAVDRLPIFVATVLYSPQQEQILLGYGTEMNVRFEQIDIDQETKLNLIIREPVKLLEGKSKDGELKSKTPEVDSSNVEYLNPANASRKNVKKVEIPMEVRLENLSTPKSSPKNMIHLLVQGLHSKDATLLKNVFAVEDSEMIQQTLGRLPAQYVSALLNELSLMMQMKTMHVKTAACWLKHLISIHASQLMALGSSNLTDNFATCVGIIEYRVQHLSSLAKLRGRLGLIIDQIERSKNQANLEGDNENVLVYQEEYDSDADSMLEKEDTDQPESSNEELYEDDDEEEEMASATNTSQRRLQNGYTHKKSHDESMEVSD